MADPIRIGAPDGSIVEFPAGTTDDTIKNVMARSFPAPEKPSAPEASSGPDVAGLAKAAGAGLVKGVASTVGAIPMLSDVMHRAADKYVFDPILGAVDRQLGRTDAEIAQRRQAADGARRFDLNKAASPDFLVAAIEKVASELHKPQNTAERYVDTVAGFVPAAAAGPGSIGTRLIMQALVPGVSSEAAGQLTEGSKVEPFARFGAALLSPFAVSGGVRAAQALREPMPGFTRYGSKHLVNAMEADTPAAIQSELQRLGPDAMLADAGPAFLGKTQGASLNSDEGRSIVFNALKNRDKATNSRIMSDVERALGPAEDPVTATKNIVDYRTRVDNHNYPLVLDNAPPVRVAPILTELDDAIGGAVGSEQKALQNLKTMLMREEQQPRIDPYSGHQVIGSNGQPVFDRVPVSQDRAAVLHKVKQELDNVIEHELPGLGVQAGALRNQQYSLKRFRHDLNQALEDQVPNYARANRVSERLAKRAEAVKAGSQYLGEGKTTPSPSRFLDEFEQKDLGERIAFNKGSRGEIDRVLGVKANDLQALRRELQGEGGWNTDKIAIVHGNDAARQLMDSVERNLKFRDTHNKVSENSQTEIRRAAREQMKPYGLDEGSLVARDTTPTGLALSAMKRGVMWLPTKAHANLQNLGREEVARVVTATGTQRDRFVQSIADALSRRQAAQSVLGTAAYRALAAALMERQNEAARGH